MVFRLLCDDLKERLEISEFSVTWDLKLARFASELWLPAKKPEPLPVKAAVYQVPFLGPSPFFQLFPPSVVKKKPAGYASVEVPASIPCCASENFTKLRPGRELSKTLVHLIPPSFVKRITPTESNVGWYSVPTAQPK